MAEKVHHHEQKLKGTFYSIKDIPKRKKFIIPSDHRNISK